MGSPPIKITRTLLTFKSMVLKLHVKLKGDNDKFTFKYHSETEYMYQRYLSLNPSVFLTLGMVDKETDVGFDKSKNVMVTQRTIFQLIMFFRRLVKHMYEKELFVIKNDHIMLQSDVANKCKELLQITSSHVIMGIPAVIYDENEVSYEGVHLFLNQTANVIPLSFNELETLLYTLEKVDLFQYSQMLLNYYVSYYRDELKHDQSVINRYTSNRFNWDKRLESSVSSNFVKETEDIMSGLPK